MKTSLLIRKPAQRAVSRLQRWSVPAGAFAWVFSTLLTASSMARGEDMDIYTKALTSGVTGSPVLLFQIDNSGSMLQDINVKTSTSTADATSIMTQRLYRMVDVAMAQVSGMKSTYQIGLTTYAASNTGLLVKAAAPLETQYSSTAGTTTFSVADENDDSYQFFGGSVSTGDGTTPMQPVAVATSGTMGTMQTSTAISSTYSGTWPSAESTTYAPTYELPAATGSSGKSSGLLVGLTGNTVIWYKHGSSDDTSGTSSATTSHQIFKVTGATTDSYIVVTDENGVVKGQSDNISNVRTNATTDCNTTPVVASGGNDSCLAIVLNKNTWYRIVIGTNTLGATGSYTFTIQNPSRAASYSVETKPPKMPTRAGLRFRRIDIPRGATITNAYLEFKPTASDSTAGKWRAGVDTAISPATPLVSPYGRAMDWSSVQTLSSWSTDTVSANTRVSVTSQVQSHVNLSSWCGGDMYLAAEVLPYYDGSAISTSSSSTDAARSAYAFEGYWPNNGDYAQPARLVVTWTAPASTPSGCDTATYTQAVTNISDDVQQSSTGAITYDGASLSVSTTTQAGLRFPLLPIPYKAIITSAKLELTPASGAAQTLKIHAVEADNADAFSGAVNALDALPTVVDPATSSDTVSWTPGSWTAGTPVQSVDLSGLVQQLVNRDGWVYDNGIALLVEGSSATASTFYTWERTVSGSNSLDRTQYGRYSARLIISYKDASGAALPVLQTHRWRLYNAINSIGSIVNTPIMGTYIESAQYMLGWDGYTMPALSTGDCATNGIVFLTDGEENGSYSSTQKSTTTTISGKSYSSATSPPPAWQAIYDMAAALYTKKNTHADGNKYSIRTDAIGFGPDLDTSPIAGVEGKGGGKFYKATDSAELNSAFHDIIANMSISTASVAASGVAVNALNRFEHLDQLYYSLFAPATTVDWSGNLKRYRLKDSKVVDVSNLDAIDWEDTGFFRPDARSYWSTYVDGSNVGVGGAAGKTPDASRQLYTFLNSPYPTLPTTLTDTIATTNTGLTYTVLGLDRLASWNVTGGLDTTLKKDARKNQVITYLRTAPVTDNTIRWGSAIHGSPRVVTFKSDPVSPVIGVFYADNRGYIHGVDAGGYSSDTTSTNLSNSGGTELFGFIPKETLRNAALLQENTQKISDKGYLWGMDGDLSVYTQDSNSDGDLDKALLFVGMRRGGSNYYALDITKSRADVASGSRVPKLQWVIEGGATSNFSEMGQTWSGLAETNVKVNGSTVALQAFGGGYDPAYHDDGSFANPDGVSYTNTNQKGRAVYLVNRDSGTLYWKSTQLSTTTFPALAYMKYSITATPKVIDRNNDGIDDLMYVVDLAGQVFRFEFDQNATSASNLVSRVVLVAQLGATASGADATIDNRRFYEPPSVARVGNDLIIALSSGYREEPRSKKTKEALFVIKDLNGYTNTSVPATLKLGDLTNLTGTAAGTSASASSPGWYLYLDQALSEKGVGSPVIFNYSVLMATWKSSNADFDCAPDIGETALYFMDLTGKGLTASDRYVDIKLPGMGDTPQMLFQPGSKLAIGVGIRILDPSQICGSATDCPLQVNWSKWKRSSWKMVNP